MGSRRRFLGGLLASGLGLGAASKALANAGKSQPRSQRPDPPGYAWQRTIFCQLEDAALLGHIYTHARCMGVELFLGRPDAPDLFAIPCFVAILDRTTVPDDMWTEFLDYRQEVEDEVPILLVDGLGASGAWALDAGMQVVEPRGEQGLGRLKQAVGEAHRVALRWQPELEML